MTCRECLEKFSALSADDVKADHAISIRAHITACPQCQQEWKYFEHTLWMLSTSSQTLPSADISEAMWQHCSEHIFQKTEKQRHARAGVAGWLIRQPRWGWASLGGALAILGAAWYFAPHDEALDLFNDGVQRARTPVAQAGFGGFRAPSPGALVKFERPPAAASGLVNHHSGLAADPLGDSVGSTMVSYSATTPITTNRAPVTPSTLTTIAPNTAIAPSTAVTPSTPSPTTVAPAPFSLPAPSAPALAPSSTTPEPSGSSTLPDAPNASPAVSEAGR